MFMLHIEFPTPLNFTRKKCFLGVFSKILTRKSSSKTIKNDSHVGDVMICGSLSVGEFSAGAGKPKRYRRINSHNGAESFREAPSHLLATYHSYTLIYRELLEEGYFTRPAYTFRIENRIPIRA